MRAVARTVLSGVALHVEGRENVPRSGPALLIARHYHHLYDGAALVLGIARPVHILVGLDWVKDARQRAYMEAICHVAGWPIVLREATDGNPWGAGYEPRERRRYARAALERSVDLVCRGALLAVFPQGYPAIDPLRPGDIVERPHFAAGYLAIASAAQRRGADVPLVPAGLWYEEREEKLQRIVLRFGRPERIAQASDRAAAGRRVEAAVRELSADGPAR